jgi:hypothetical protein
VQLRPAVLIGGIADAVVRCQQGAEQPLEDEGEVSGSIILLSFSLEVIIKAISVKAGENSIRSHDLGRLFRALPCQIQNSAEQRFAEAWKVLNECETPTTLREMLDNAATNFEDWRYQYEGNQPRLEGYVGGMQCAYAALQEEYNAA